MKKLIRSEFCLPPEVKDSFVSHRPAPGEHYPISRLKPYTFGTDPAQTEQLRISAAAFGVDLVVEGHGLKWTGLQMKLIAFRDYIVQKTSPGDIVMMMDANDVLFVGEPQQILDAYQELGAPIVASAERGCAPQGSVVEEDLICVSEHSYSPFFLDVRCMLCVALFVYHAVAGGRQQRLALSAAPESTAVRQSGIRREFPVSP